MNRTDSTLACHLADDAATEALGRALAHALAPGLHLQLHGNLGAGKTTLVRAVLRELGVTGPIKSPTYALVERYPLTRIPIEFGNSSNIYFYHFDFYRFNRESEWLEAGFRDDFGPQSICAVEWPEQAGDLLPAPDLDIRLVYADPGRDVTLSARSPAGAACLAKLKMPAASSGP